MVAVHQFVPTLAPRDAVGAHSIAVQSVLRDAGYRSDIYVLESRGRYRKGVRDYHDFDGGRPGEPTWIFFQMSVGAPVCDFVVARAEPLIVNYHNITPTEYFAPWEPIVAANLSRGRRQLRSLARRADVGIAVSEFNEKDLITAGFGATDVAPVLVDSTDWDIEPDRRVMDRLRHARERGESQWLCVGRMAPNKAQHDVVKALDAYRRFHDPNARVHFVGGSSSHAYESALAKYVAELGLTEHVEFAGSVSGAALAGYYEAADVLVVASEHEGFCVPLLEAMHHRLPIVAYACGGVRETLDRGGLLLDRKDPLTIAAAVARVVADESLRAALVTAGQQRLGEYSLTRSKQRLLDAVRARVGAPG